MTDMSELIASTSESYLATLIPGLILLLAQSNPIVRSVLLRRSNNFLTYEQMLIAMVDLLVKENERLRKFSENVIKNSSIGPMFTMRED